MKVTIIAEIGINHTGNMDLLKEMVFRAKDCGCDVAKTQLYDPFKLFPDKEILINGKNWYQEVEKTKLTREQLSQFIAWCNEAEIEGMASAFDFERLGWLEEIGVKRHKIATRMNRNRTLICAIAGTGKETLISCQDRLQIKPIPFDNVRYLYCVPHYPAQPSELEFNQFEFPIDFQGFSDHTIGIEASCIAMSRGAIIIEKHFCLKRDNSNPDMVCSIEPDELKALVGFARKVEEIP